MISATVLWVVPPWFKITDRQIFEYFFRTCGSFGPWNWSL